MRSAVNPAERSWFLYRGASSSCRCDNRVVESVIRDEGITLRLWSAADKGAVNSIVASSRTELDGWLPGLVSNLQDFDAFVERVIRCASDEIGWYYAVEADGCVVGQCSLEVDDEGAAEVGYWIRSDRANEGITTRAVRALCRAAGAHGFEPMFIHCDEGNLASAAIAQKLGFDHLRTVDLLMELPPTGVRTGREMTWVLPLGG
jgi:RimJ/RimL family protein N-acetyltransferase